MGAGASTTTPEASHATPGALAAELRSLADAIESLPQAEQAVRLPQAEQAVVNQALGMLRSAMAARSRLDAPRAAAPADVSTPRSGDAAAAVAAAPPTPAFAPTAKQLEGQRVAAEAIQAVVEKIPPELKDQVGHAWNNKSCQGGALEELLHNTDLTDAQYLISLYEAGGILPRCQDVPAAAKINKKNIWRLSHAWGGGFQAEYRLPVLLWTYCWYV